jgi:ribosomal protein L16 Arg81 hydroxylase
MVTGGLLFVPRGWWHETESSGPSLQVNFVLNRPMWLDVATRALLRRLRRDPDWREYAFDVFGPAERREAALAKFAGLLAGLGRELESDDYASLAAELVEDAGFRPAAARAAGMAPQPAGHALR